MCCIAQCLASKFNGENNVRYVRCRNSFIPLIIFFARTYRKHFFAVCCRNSKIMSCIFSHFISQPNRHLVAIGFVSRKTSIFFPFHPIVDTFLPRRARAERWSVILGSMTIIHFALATSKTIKNEAAQCPGKPLSGDSPPLFPTITIILYLFCAAALCAASPSAVIINM